MTIKAYQAYRAAMEDPHCSRADLARLTRNLKSERQSDRERARYHHMQEEEAAVLAAAAAGDYDSDRLSRLRVDLLCMFVVPHLIAMLHFRYGRLGSHLTLRAFYLCLYFY
jgi:hypothetical protein